MKPPSSTEPTRDTLAREVAHDFNNLLTAIIGAADSVLERSRIDLETRADIAHIREGARRAAGLVGRPQSGPDVPLDDDVISVNETIRATSRLLAHRLGPNIALTLSLEEPDDQARVEPSQLDRVLLNLIANARHAMQAGGEVVLRTERRLLAVAIPRLPDTIPAGDYVVISVADTGIGISSDHLPRIFDPGFSSRHHAGGSGLGLASVHDTVRRSNGFLAVESVEGRGTRFEIFLPRQACDVLTRRSAAPGPLAAERVALLVEDDPLVRQVAERILRRAGWTVLCADSAEVALEVLQESSCDLMISDVVMLGMDGLTLTRLVLTRQPDLPVILTSGYVHNPEDARFGTANVAFLTKPYGRADLLAVVSRLIREEPARSSPSA